MSTVNALADIRYGHNFYVNPVDKKFFFSFLIGGDVQSELLYYSAGYLVNADGGSK